MKYVPAIMKEDSKIEEACNQQIEKFLAEKRAVVDKMKATNKKKERLEAKLMNLKDANRFFFTSNPAQGPMYIPESQRVEEK